MNTIITTQPITKSFTKVFKVINMLPYLTALLFLFLSGGVWGQLVISTTNTFSTTSLDGWDGTMPTGFTQSRTYRGTTANTTGGTYAIANSGLGWQASSSVKSLSVEGTFRNETGTTIESVTIEYDAFRIVTRTSRTPGWSVKSSLGAVSDLNWTYNSSATNASPDVKTLTLTGLSIPNNSNFTITWASDRGAGSGSSPLIGLRNIKVRLNAAAANPTIALSDNGTQVGAGNVNQGALNHILSQTKAEVTVSSATLNTFTFNTGGTYATSDIVNFKLRYSSDATLDAGDALLSTVTTIPATGNTVTFSSLTQGISNNSTGYFFVTADIAASAVALKTISAGIPTYTFAAGTPTGTMTAGGAQTIQAVTPAITLANNDTQIAAGNLAQNTDNHILSSFQISTTTANAVLDGVNITTTGTYAASDVNDLKLWYSTDNTFNSATDVTLTTIASPTTAGSKNFTGFTQTLTNGSTGYFFITINAPCTAVPSNTIAVSSIANTDLSFTASVNRSGSASAAGIQTITAVSPNNVTGLAVSAENTQLATSWTNPTGCFDEIILVAHTSSISGTPTGTYSASSLSYTDVNNPTFPGGGVVVYNGSTSPQTITNLTNGINYFVKAFTRNGSTWSPGIEVSGVPFAPPALIISQYYEGASNNKWIEITNVGTTTIDLESPQMYLALFANDNADNPSASSPNNTETLTGTLAPGAILLFKNSGAALPNSANITGTASNSTTCNFNGDDLLILTTSNSSSNGVSWAARTDVVGDGSNWGADKSFYRNSNITSPNTTWDINDWTEVTNAIVNGAAVGTAERLGFHQFSTSILISTLSGNWNTNTTWLGGIVPTSGANVTIAHDVNLNIDATVNDLTLNADVSLSITPTFTLTLNGSFSGTGLIVGSSTANLSIGGSGSLSTLSFDQTTPGTTNVLNNLNLNRSSETLNIGNNLNILGAFTLTQGNVNTGENKIILGPTATITETNTARVIGTVETTRTVNQNVANAFGFIGVEITPLGSNMGSTKVTRTTGTAYTGLSGNSSLQRLFQVEPTTNVGLNATVIMEYFANELGSLSALSTAQQANNFIIYKRPLGGSASDWVRVPNGLFVEAASDGGFIEVTGVPNFSEITIGDDVNSPLSNETLPVELISFKAEPKENKVQITWETASELNNHYFELERLGSTKKAENIARIYGQGTTSNATEYQFIDETPNAGVNYYQLVQTDFDGTQTTYGPVAVNFGGENNFVLLQNKYLAHQNMLVVSAAENENILVECFDATGKIHSSSVYHPESKISEINIDSFGKGLVLVRLTQKAAVITLKIVR